MMDDITYKIVIGVILLLMFITLLAVLLMVYLAYPIWGIVTIAAALVTCIGIVAYTNL